jgi:hypothetical protein
VDGPFQFGVVIRRTIFVASVVCTTNVECIHALGADTEPIERYLEWQRKFNCVSMQIDCRLTTTGLSASKANRQEIITFLRRSDRRLDLQSQIFPEKYRSRTVVLDGQDFSYRTTDLKSVPSIGTVSRDQGEAEGSIESGTALDGYFPGNDGRSIADLLQFPATKKNTGGYADVNGERCVTISAKTPYGQLTLWLARDKDYVPLRVIFSKDVFDRWVGSTPVSSIKYRNEFPVQRWSAVLSDVELSKVDGTFVPIQGKLMARWSLKDGRTIVEEARYNRSAIHFTADFSDDKTAFVFDLPDGSEIRSELPNATGRQFVWRNGEIEEGIPEHLDRANESWSLFDLGLIAFDAILVLLGIRFFLTGDKRRKSNGSKLLRS